MSFASARYLTPGSTYLSGSNSNSMAMDCPRPWMSLPPMFRTCPFLIIAIA
jgi:hypothetical protein